MNKEKVIETLFDTFSDIRYVAIYLNSDLVFKQRSGTPDTSDGETDTFEELLVNPTLLTLASQRGNIDCGGLDYLIVSYGNFHQLVRSVKGGHISICLNKDSDIINLPAEIFNFLNERYSDYLVLV